MRVKVDSVIYEIPVTLSTTSGTIMFGFLGHVGDKIHYFLRQGKVIKCVVNVDDADYHFNISPNGYLSITENAEVKKYFDAAESRMNDLVFYEDTKIPTVPFITGMVVMIMNWKIMIRY